MCRDRCMSLIKPSCSCCFYWACRNVNFISRPDASTALCSAQHDIPGRRAQSPLHSKSSVQAQESYRIISTNSPFSSCRAQPRHLAADDNWLGFGTRFLRCGLPLAVLRSKWHRFLMDAHPIFIMNVTDFDRWVTTHPTWIIVSANAVFSAVNFFVLICVHSW